MKGKPGMAQACNPCTWDVKTIESGVQGQPQLHKILFQKTGRGHYTYKIEE